MAEKSPTGSSHALDRRVWFALLAVLLVAMSYRLWFGSELLFPIDNDAAYYRGMGRQVLEGFGEQNLAWHYLSGKDPLPSPSFAYWMPLPALLSGLSGALFGGGPGAETLPGVLASVGLSALCLLLAWRLGASLAAALGAGLLSVFLWATTYASLDGDSPIFYAFFLNLLFVALTWLRERPLPAAVVAGAALALAHLSRSDAVLLLPVLAIWGAYESRWGDLQVPRRAVVAGVASYLVLMAPLLVRNLVVFGAPLPPGSSKAIWAVNYYDIYALTAPSAGTWWEQGVGTIVAAWQRGLSGNVGLLAGVFPVLLWPFLLGGIKGVRGTSAGRSMLLWAVVLIFFHGTVLAVVGGFKRSYVALIPLVVAGAWCGWHRLAVRSVELWGQRGRIAAGAAALVLLAPGAWFALERGPEYRRNYAEQTAYDLGRHAALAEWFDAQASAQAVVASPKPFFPWYATGRPCVMVPQGGGDALADVIERFGVTHLVVDMRRTSERPDLGALYSRVAAGESIFGMVPVTRIADLVVYGRP